MRQACLIFTLLLLGPASFGGEDGTVLVLETGGTLIGRFALTESPTPDGLTRRTHITTAKLSLLGQPFDVNVTESTIVDPETGKIVRAERLQVSAGSSVAHGAEVSGEKVRFSDGTEAEAKNLIDPLDAASLLRATAAGPEIAQVLSLQLSRVVDVAVTRLEGEDDLLRFRVTSDDLPLDLEVRFHAGDSTFAGLTDKRQQTTIRPASPAVLEAADRLEILEGAVLPVHLPVADFRTLRHLRIRAVIETPGGSVTPEELNVPGQKFEGTVDEGAIRGVFTIESRRYDGKGAPTIGPREAKGLEEFLRAGPMIDKDHESVVERMKALVAPSSSMSEWRFATLFAWWVSENIAYGPPGKKASDVLADRSGDCGGQARLTVALCRAAGIPARVVSGGMYTVYLGGSFSPHAWVEVHMGEAGWIPIDPTAGETDYVDAGHIRIGLAAGFLPKEIEILDYEPKPTPAEAKPIPFERGKEYVYEYLINGTRIGENRFVFEAEGSRHRVTVKTKIGANSSESVLVTDAFGHPVSYEITARGVGGEGSATATVVDGTATIRAEPPGRAPVELTRQIGDDCYVFDNNSLPHWALFLPLIGLEPGKTTDIKAFHPQLAQVLPIKFVAGQWTEKEWGDKTVDALPLTVTLAGKQLEMWVDRHYRLLEDQEAGLIVRLLPPPNDDGE